jgi:hypothetical protein
VGARPGRLAHGPGSPPRAGPARAAGRGGLGAGRGRRGPGPDLNQPGVDARGWAQTARAAWHQATTRFEQVEGREGAWGRVGAALELFRADGPLNDRAHAPAEIAATLWDRPSPAWAQVRNFLPDPRSLTFLDRRHRRRESAEPRPEGREARAWRWGLRPRRPTPSGPRTTRGQALGRDRPLTEEEEASSARVAAVLKDTVGVRSAVACRTSVLRRPPSRHRRRTQPRLDLKRLSWNCRLFRSGPRKDTRPSPALGLEWPTFDFWALLQSDPERLAQELSTSRNAE